MNNSFDKDLIKQTLVESKKAFDNNDVPVGAILRSIKSFFIYIS